MKLSVLISVYHAEKAEFFKRALESIWDEQTLKPDEIVLVEDGSLTPELYAEIESAKSRMPITSVQLKTNVGLGDALREGIKFCKGEFIARMDTDDISRPNRFKTQMDFLTNNPEFDIVGSWIGEFESDENIIVSHRKTPQKHDDILKFAKKRNPMNHVTVIFRASAVIKAGSYVKSLGFEDYDLWVRMLQQGSLFANIEQDLVAVRIGNGLIGRRRGLFYAANELKFQNQLRKYGFISVTNYLMNVAVRLSSRMMPPYVLRFVYKIIRS